MKKNTDLKKFKRADTQEEEKRLIREEKLAAEQRKVWMIFTEKMNESREEMKIAEEIKKRNKKNASENFEKFQTELEKNLGIMREEMKALHLTINNTLRKALSNNNPQHKNSKKSANKNGLPPPSKKGTQEFTITIIKKNKAKSHKVKQFKVGRLGKVVFTRGKSYVAASPKEVLSREELIKSMFSNKQERRLMKKKGLILIKELNMYCYQSKM